MTEVRVLVEASTKEERDRREWGLAILIDDTILFDTFSNEEALRKGFAREGKDVHALTTVVISHDHWDHTGGLPWVLRENPSVTVYIGEGFGDEVKQCIRDAGATLVTVRDACAIEGNVSSTGICVGTYKGAPLPEHALIVETGEGLALLTGCAHPGVISFLHRAHDAFGKFVTTIIGGLHLNATKEKDVITLANDLRDTYHVTHVHAFHCTGADAINTLSRVLGDVVVPTTTGARITLPS